MKGWAIEDGTAKAGAHTISIDGETVTLDLNEGRGMMAMGITEHVNASVFVALLRSVGYIVHAPGAEADRARSDGEIARLAVEEERSEIEDCGQDGVCKLSPGCNRHWEERNRELVRENETLRSNSDHLSSENASLASQVESMAMRIESLAGELAKPEDVRLREVVDALDGRAVIFDGLGARIGHLLDETDEWIVRAGEAERRADEYDAKLTAVRVALTEAGGK